MRQFLPLMMLLAGMMALAPMQQAAAKPSPLLMQRLLYHPDTGKRTYLGESFLELDGVRAFYAARDYEPVWTQQRLIQLRYAFMAARQAGFNPSDYHYNALSREYSNDNEMAIELLATDAWLALADALAGNSGSRADMTVYLEQALAGDRVYPALAELISFYRAP